MSKCKHCGMELSNSVRKIHEKSCLERQEILKATKEQVIENEESQENLFDDELTKEQVIEMGVREMKDWCKSRDLEGYSNLNKEDLIDFIIDCEV